MYLTFSRRRRNRRFLLPILLLLIGISGFCVYHFRLPEQREQVSQPPFPASAEYPQPSAAPPPAFALQAETPLQLCRIYLCGHLSETAEDIPPQWIGKTQREVEALQPDWHFLSFTEKAVLAEKNMDTVCDAHYIMRLERETLMVTYQNQPDKIRFQRTININLLPLETIDMLNRGIPIDGETELLEYMENFFS